MVSLVKAGIVIHVRATAKIRYLCMSIESLFDGHDTCIIPHHLYSFMNFLCLKKWYPATGSNRRPLRVKEVFCHWNERGVLVSEMGLEPTKFPPSEGGCLATSTLAGNWCPHPDSNRMPQV